VVAITSSTNGSCKVRVRAGGQRRARDGRSDLSDPVRRAARRL